MEAHQLFTVPICFKHFVLTWKPFCQLNKKQSIKLEMCPQDMDTHTFHLCLRETDKGKTKCHPPPLLEWQHIYNPIYVRFGQFIYKRSRTQNKNSKICLWKVKRKIMSSPSKSSHEGQKLILNTLLRNEQDLHQLQLHVKHTTVPETLKYTHWKIHQS